MTTSIKIKFRPSTVPGNPGSIYYQVSHDRQIRQILTPYRILPSEWDSTRSMVLVPEDSPRQALIRSIHLDIRADLERLTIITRQFDNRCSSYTAADIVDEFRRYASDYTLFSYMERIIARLKTEGRIRTSETYHSTLLSFRKFRQERDLMLDRITPDLMESYQTWLMGRGVVPNTASFYIRILRAVYNRAVQSDIIPDRSPFRRVYTGVDKTVKRALPINVIKRIRKLDLRDMPAMDYARDMFMLSFYMRGMSFIDMAYLCKSDLSNGCITYRRRKTGQLLNMAWTPEMQAIVDKYPANSSRYLLPIIRDKDSDNRSAYRNMAYKINCQLKKVGQMVKVSIPLTLYVARHSWASVARAKGIPLAIISEGLGHDSELTTRIYLAGLDAVTVDNANSRIINAIK